MDNLSFGKMKTSESFSREIDALVTKHGMKFIDAIVYHCEQSGMELEVAASLCKTNTRLKAHIQQEGEDLNILARTAKLPL